MKTSKTHYFPFGNELKPVVQKKSELPKKAFVLGVYASAVHACWVDKNGKEKVKALAVASEPEIFWKGEDAANIISRIVVPKELGRLTLPSDKKLNGPSGIVLDELFLSPLGLDRRSTWLCDLLPESRVNAGQAKALTKHYTDDIIEKYQLKPASIPTFSKSELKNNSTWRRDEILAELKASNAETVILLGDLPIKWFLTFFDKKYKKLSDFGEDETTYGKGRKIEIDGISYNVIALCHPRNAGKLGSYSPKWWKLHQSWLKNLS